ncbi:hypothetical protein JZ751_013461, partial [Albula glossodonta]
MSDTLSDKRLLAIGKDDLLGVEIESFIYCISAFVKLAQKHHQKKTFDSLIQVRGQRARR